MMVKNVKKYDVVILTHAPSDEFLISLNKFFEQEIKPQSIIVVNTDKEIFLKNITNCEELKKCINNKDKNNIKLYKIDIEKKDFDHGWSRNIAIKYIKSDYVLFMTDDAIPYDRELSKNMIRAFDKYSDNDYKVAVVYARQIAKKGSKIVEKYVREYNYPDYDIVKEKKKESELGIKNYFCSNVCAMYDVDIFRKNDGFEENIILNEDMYYAYKVINDGYRVVYSADAKVYHSHDYSFREQFSRNFDIGVSQYDKKEIFDKLPSTNEGFKLLKYVMLKLLCRLRFISMCSFVIECFYRYRGFKLGRKYKTLTIDKCIEYSSNKDYFTKGKYKK